VQKNKYFPDGGCVRTLRNLYVYATGWSWLQEAVSASDMGRAIT